MLRLVDDFEILYIVVAAISVAVVDVLSFGDWASVVLPYDPVKPNAFALEIEPAEPIANAKKFLASLANAFDGHSAL